jgi:prepilin-type N-terminal cleavage/methylation domain-containing protein
MRFFKKVDTNKGFTLVETLVAVAIFVMVSVAIYSGFVGILKIMNTIRVKGIMTNVANEQFEIVRNLPYKDVGTVSGIPSGLLSQSQTTSRDGKNFTIETVVRNVDEPFDGTFNGTPKDLSPADMKMIEVTITCTSCTESLSPVSFTTKIAPKALETASVNGALVIKVFDASGLPVAGADVNILNNNITPTVNLNDATDINGVLTIVDAPPSVSGYQITVSKEGYSTERTYPVGGSGNLHPTKPNMTVVVQQISQISFTIDKTSTINVSTINNQCIETPNFNFSISGNKLIGTNPNTLKYTSSFSTDSDGKRILPNIEWDTYNIIGTDSVSDIIGTNPLLSLGVNPDIEQDMQIITAPKNGRRLLVVVRDQSTGLPVSDATVDLVGPSSYSKSVITNEGFINQSDWSGGASQTDFEFANKYLSGDGNVDDTTSPGDLSLKKISGSYVSSGNITSSTFDTGATSNFKQIIWSPATAPVQTGATSVRFQIATNNDNTTWNFIGPDGTSSSYYLPSNQNITAINNGDRYLRYRLYLSTLNTAYTPTISDVSVTYSSSCIPPGQVSFSALSSGTYTISVSKTGYQSTSRNVTISNNWSKEEFTISP